MNCQPLTLSQVEFQYPSNELSIGSQPLLHQISLTLPPTGMLHIRGSNGSGKTSLLKLLAGMFRPDAGEIKYGDVDIWSNITAYQQNLSYLGHKNGFNPGLTVWEHCHLDWHIPPDASALTQMLQNLDLWSVKDRACYLLSAGQKRRVALLRLLSCATQLWLLDEPLVALDAAGVTFLMACLQQHISQGGQVIYTSHQPLPWHATVHQEYAL